MTRIDPGLDPRLSLKITPPRISKTLLDRAALSLDGPRLGDAPIIAVEAPAGFGKTSLLCQWRRASLRRGAAVPWLGADEADEPVRFIQAIACSTARASGRPRSAGLRLDISLRAELDGVTEWLAEIAESACETVLMIDEADRLPARTLSGPFEYLLANAPGNLRVVFAARQRIPLRIHRRMDHGFVARVSAEDLRFSLRESLAVLRARFGTRMDPDAAARIHEITQGWPLGIQLATASIGAESDAREPIARRLFESLLAQRPPAEREFLVRISIVERVRPELCAALTGRNAARILGRLHATTPLFQESLEGDWLAMHPLARELLRPEFARLPLSTQRSVHAAAAAYFESHRLDEEAARHALNAGQNERAWALADRSLFRAVAQGQVARVREWFERVPPSRYSLSPQLLLAAGWSSALVGRHREAQRFASRVLRTRRSTRDERSLATLMLSASEIYVDRIDRAQRLIEQWHAKMPWATGPAFFNDRNQLGMLALYRGRPADARRLLKHALPPTASAEVELVKAFNAAVEGMTYLWEGHVTRAAAVLSAALAESERAVGRRTVPVVTLAGLAALAHWECDEPDAASAALLGRLDVIEQLATPSGLIAGFTAAARLAFQRGEERKALELLEDARAIGASRRMPRVQIIALAEMIRLHGASSRARTCTALLGRLDAVVASVPRRFRPFKDLLELHRHLAAAHAARAAESWQSVLTALEPAARLAAALHRGLSAIEIELLRAQALHARGEEARPALEEAVSLARSLGLRRLLGEPGVQRLCRTLGCAGDERAAAPAPPADGEHRAIRIAAPARRVAAAALLTPKEQEVLELLAQRLSNKQIAMALDIGQTTIKWHLKNVFSKLNAASRHHAVQRAMMLDILRAG